MSALFEREPLWFVIDKPGEKIQAKRVKVDREVLRLLWNWSVFTEKNSEEEDLPSFWKLSAVEWHGTLYVRGQHQYVHLDLRTASGGVKYAHKVKSFVYNPNLLSWVVFMEEQDTLQDAGDVMVFSIPDPDSDNSDEWDHEMSYFHSAEDVAEI